MKIIHFIPSIDRTAGGTTSYMQLLAKELGKLCELYIVTAPSANPVEMENAQIKLIPCNWKQKKAMKSAWSKLLQEINPDIVHVNCCWLPQCTWAQLWAQKAGYKVVLSPHGMLEPWIMARHYWTRKFPALLLYQKEAIRKADCLHATAESERKNLLKLGYNNRIEIIANGIDVENIEIKKEWKHKKQILFLSRIHVKKGIDFLLEAVAELKKELTGYIVHIAGEGEANYINLLKEKAKLLGIESIVDFCGGVYGEKKWQLFRDADVFILPTYSENFGIAIAEALASGTPVITTNGTPWEELNICHCGWYTEIGTIAMVQAIHQFLQTSEEDLEAMGKRGRKLIEQKYSTIIMATKMKELYVRLHETK